VPNGTPQREGERVRASREEDSSPPGVGGAADAARPPGKSPAPAPLPTAAPDSRQQQEAAFRELRALWRRGWPGDDTPKAIAIVRSAFRSACALAEPAEIIEAAKTWIAAADAPRFLQPLPQWLAARGWETPPPQRARSSPPRRHQRGGRRNGRVNVADVFFAIAAEDDARRAAS
jgi:hypothetical protein